MCKGDNVEITCPLAEGYTVVRVVRDDNGRLVLSVGIAYLVVLSWRFGGIESVEGVPVVVVWLFPQGVVVYVSLTGWTPGDQYE